MDEIIRVLHMAKDGNSHGYDNIPVEIFTSV